LAILAKKEKEVEEEEESVEELQASRCFDVFEEGSGKTHIIHLGAECKTLASQRQFRFLLFTLEQQ